MNEYTEHIETISRIRGLAARFRALEKHPHPLKVFTERDNLAWQLAAVVMPLLQMLDKTRSQNAALEARVQACEAARTALKDAKDYSKEYEWLHAHRAEGDDVVSDDWYEHQIGIALSALDAASAPADDAAQE